MITPAVAFATPSHRHYPYALNDEELGAVQQAAVAIPTRERFVPDHVEVEGYLEAHDLADQADLADQLYEPTVQDDLAWGHLVAALVETVGEHWEDADLLRPLDLSGEVQVWLYDEDGHPRQSWGAGLVPDLMQLDEASEGALLAALGLIHGDKLRVSWAG